MVARFLPDGAPDSTFGVGGVTITPTGEEGGADEIYDIALAGNSKLIVAGECDQVETGGDVCVARYKVGEDD